MWFHHARIFTEEGYRFGSFAVSEGRFSALSFAPEGGDGIDLGGAKVLPGLVDIHIHGAHGADFSDGDEAGLRRMALWLASHGITSFAPTSMTLPYPALRAAFQTAQALRRNPPVSGARIAGIHMEGPFLAEKRKGAQNGTWLRDPDYTAFQELYESCGGLIRMVDLAPEKPGAVAFAAQARKLCTVSVAHTDASYEEAAAVFDAGASHLTHLYNAMPPIHHRAPGVIGAASERKAVCAELICDGLHVHPSAVRMAFRLFTGRICLISDALRTCGMPEGEYTLAGQRILLRGGAARLSDGTLAGASVSLFDCLKNAVRFGIPEEEAIRAATLIPAREIGAESEIGSIAPGKRADFVICDEALNRKTVYLGGAPLPAEG